MTELLGAIGWGLLACGAASHLLHFSRFRELLAMHVDQERLPALLIVAVETALVVVLPVALFASSPLLGPLAFITALLGLGFLVWIARLLLTDSTLPCACSFSAAPTSVWSLVRAASVLFVSAYGFAAVDTLTPGADTIATLLVGLAVATALFVLPEALGWPPASRALMQRVEAFQDPLLQDPLVQDPLLQDRTP